MLTRHRNTPAHLYRDNTAYFITGAIYQKRHLLANPAMKQELLSLIQLYFAHYGWELQHWVILDNHYHVLGKSSKGVAITTIMRRIHSRSAVTIARMFDDVTKPIWWNYWDYCPRDEEDYYTRLNCLLMNPIKHGYTQNLNHYE